MIHDNQKWAKILKLKPVFKLEQLECLYSEIPPATPWLPIKVINIRS